MRRGRWESSGTALGGEGGRLDNLALVPASLLPHKASYQRLANRLPAGAVLVVLPTEDSAERRTLQEAAARLRAKGHALATMTIDEVLSQGRPRPGRRARAAATPPLATAAPPAIPPEQPAPVVAAAPAGGETGNREEVPPFTRELRLLRVDASRAPARYEVLQWQPTLWGGVALVRAGGALGQPAAVQVLLEAEVPTDSEVLTRLVRRRLRAGYRIADWQ
jgi:hypothetical protein